MSITDAQAKEWAEYFIAVANDDYWLSDIYEDEDFTEDYPDEADWKKVHDFMYKAKVTVTWDE